MAEPVRKHVVVSAVNLRKGGTLTVLQDCLQYLSGRTDLSVTALVHDRSLCGYPNIEYIEIPWSTKGWLHRLWCEYVTMNRISKTLPETDLWLSLHDTTPRVRAKSQAVYCHTSFPFLKVHARDWRMDPKIPLFATFTKYAYRTGIQRNQYLIVQQEWFREGLSGLTGFPSERIIVAPPKFRPVVDEILRLDQDERVPMFFYPSSPDCHKNFETLCKAAQLLENQLGEGKFKVVLTVKGDENRYAFWLKKNWGHIHAIDFRGYLSRKEMSHCYGRADCLVFPSRVETWGLPISEFKPTGKPMLLADLPYSHESAAGAPEVAFFPAEDYRRLATMMLEWIQSKPSSFAQVPVMHHKEPTADSWEELFKLLLHESITTR